ncbi:MAG: hypothetical protein ABR588_02180 [Sphingomicrobium sp.]
MKILPGTGRGTMRSMVEGERGMGFARVTMPLHRAATHRGPPPRFGEE